MIKITILIENESKDERLEAESGFSAYVETGDIRILFDTGEKGGFVRNARNLSVDLSKTTHVVFSHGHDDHTGGLQTWLDESDFNHISLGGKMQLIAHPDTLYEKRLMLKSGDYAPLNTLNISSMNKYFEIHTVKEPLRLTPEIYFLGEIPRHHPFEGKGIIGEAFRDGKWHPDHILDDSALAIQTEKGLVILTGCSHAGICNIVSYAKKVMGEERIVDIIGGLHLYSSEPADIEATAGFLEEQKVKAVHACHCTGENALDILGRRLKTGEAHTGDIFEFR